VKHPRSLIIAPQWIGDAVMTEPLLRRLHMRGEILTVGALPWVAPVYRVMPQVERVLELPFLHGGTQWAERKSLARQLRGQFDAAYVCPNSIKSALVPWWAGIAVRTGYHGEGRWLMLNRRLANPPPGARSPMVAFYSALSGEADLSADRPVLHLAAPVVNAVLSQLKLQRGTYYVLAPGSEYGSAKRWPASHYAALARQLNARSILLGSSRERALCADIARAADGGQGRQCLDWSGRTTLDQALALLAGARALISNDSGLMHVAAALGLPQVALFGSSSPLHTPPLNSRATVLWLKNDANYLPALDCAPCYARECPLGHTRCLVDIQPAQVLQRLQARQNAAI
jgi:heptosyltransferase-2